MPVYRMFFLDEGAHISQPPGLLGDNDAEAMQKARTFIDSTEIELWRGGVFVARFPRKETAAVESSHQSAE